MKKLNVSGWLFTILFWSLSSLASVKYTCQHLFEFSPIKKVSKDGEVLGAGQNGQVKLFVGPKGHFVIKNYFSKSEHRNSQIQSDLRAFRFLSKFKNRFSFDLPEVVLLSESELKLTYHEGRTVEDVLKDKTTKSEIKEKIEKAYAKLLAEIELALQHFDHVELKDGVLVAEDDQLAMGPFHFIIKKDNVIVNPETLRLTLIDPH